MRKAVLKVQKCYREKVHAVYQSEVVKLEVGKRLFLFSDGSFNRSFVRSFVALPFELLLQRKNDERRTTNDGRRTTKRRSMDCYEVSTAINAFDETTE